MKDTVKITVTVPRPMYDRLQKFKRQYSIRSDSEAIRHILRVFFGPAVGEAI